MNTPVRGLDLFRVEGPTGDDAPAERPADVERALREAGHAVARGTCWCLPWCKCRKPLVFSGIDRPGRIDI